MARRRRIQRYSAIVSWLRRLALLVVGVLLFVIFIVPMLFHAEEKLQFTAPTSSVSGPDGNDEHKDRVLNPRLQGKNAHGDHYTIDAEYAIKRDQHTLSLFGLSAELKGENGHGTFIKARQADLNDIDKKLLIKGNVNVQTTSGYNVAMDSAVFDYEAWVLS